MGPFETEREAIDAARWALTGGSPGSEANFAVLWGVCKDAGVEVGVYDERILWWLANYEPQICAVVAGLITRAAAGSP